MTAAQLLSTLEARGITLRLEASRLRYRGPRGAMTPALRAAIAEFKSELITLVEDRQTIQQPMPLHRPETRYEPFPMTDLQEAYWLGEQDFYEHRTPAFFAQEYRLVELDVSRLANALRRTVAHHDILRLRISAEGSQLVTEALPDSGVGTVDLRALPIEQARAVLDHHRDIIEDILPALAEGPPCALLVHRLQTGYRLSVVMRLVAFDGISTGIFYRDLAGFYNDPAYRPPAVELSFRDYVLALREHLETSTYQRSRDYWHRRLPALPPAPDLPSDAPPRRSRRLRFRRLQSKFPRERWLALREMARSFALPVDSVLLTLFTETLRLWSASHRFTLNVLAAHRPASDPRFSRVMGNCSSTSLLQVETARGPFADRVEALQRQLYADLEHNAVSGVEIIRQIRQHQAAGDRPLMPVVFTSALGLATDLPGFHLPLPGAELAHSSLKTPQVWLDQQVYEEHGDLVFNWDFLPDVFSEDMVAAMADHHRQHFETLTRDATAWQAQEPFPLPAAQLRERRQANATARDLQEGTLHGFVEQHFRHGGERTAVIDDEGAWSFRQLDDASRATARALLAAGTRHGDLVGVIEPKGRRQVAAVLGVLRAGAAYLPLESKLPPARIAQIIEHSRAAAVLADAAWTADIPADCRLVAFGEGRGSRQSAPPAAGDPEDIAYVIYTSGSTGQPKGVVIDHRGAVNTVQDINERFGVGPQDRTLAVSALGFDLSVFDIFGALAAGAAIVAPPDSDHPDPEAWARRVMRHRVTLWNSVPALLEMTLEYLGDEDAASQLASLRLILLSGDWIPLQLVDRLRRTLPGAQVIALGGATEASIWSNFFPTRDLDPAWTSVPYGTPLSNQTFHVLDDNLAPVPTWAVGDLYIGGRGVAKGYLHDPAKTAVSFVPRPGSGERLYKTGDLARYRPGGLVEFLGRKDFQVKIRGFRVELGEIEIRLAEHPGVEQAVALVAGDAGGEQTLLAFVTGAELASETLTRFIADRLPSYMVPASIFHLEKLPLSANGKVDRGALRTRVGRLARGGCRQSPPSDAIERRLAKLWTEVLGREATSTEDDFFELGGNSMMAVRLFRAVERKFGTRLPLSSLFESGTIAEQARLLRQLGGGDAPLMVSISARGRAPLFVIHPVGGNILCYRELARQLEPDLALHGLRARGTEAGETPVASLADMAATAVAEIRGHTSRADGGPIHLGGWSMGGMLAYEIARQLQTAGEPLGHLFLIDSWITGAEPQRPDNHFRTVAAFYQDALGGAPVADELAEVASLPDRQQLRHARAALEAAGRPLSDVDPQDLERLFALYLANYQALRDFRPLPLAWPAVLYQADRSSAASFPGLRPFADWLAEEPVAAAACQVVTLAEDHYSIMTGDAIRRLGQEISETCSQLEEQR